MKDNPIKVYRSCSKEKCIVLSFKLSYGGFFVLLHFGQLQKMLLFIYLLLVGIKINLSLLVSALPSYSMGFVFQDLYLIIDIRLTKN